jgi:hypothetical protein
MVAARRRFGGGLDDDDDDDDDDDGNVNGMVKLFEEDNFLCSLYMFRREENV